MPQYLTPHCYIAIRPFGFKAKSVNVEVSRFNIKLQTGFCDETICKTTNALITYTKLLNITFYESWTRTLVQNTSVSGGISVIEGNGFNMSSAGYRCKLQFSNNSLYYVVSPPAFPVSSTRIICFLPKWPFEIIETKIVLYQNDLPVQKRDTSFEQNHTLTGFCKQTGGFATAFVHGISTTVYSRHSNSTIPVVMLQNENGDFIYINKTMTNTNKFAALIKTLIPESHISRDDFEVATIYNATKLPEGVTHTWISSFRLKQPFFSRLYSKHLRLVKHQRIKIGVFTSLISMVYTIQRYAMHVQAQSSLDGIILVRAVQNPESNAGGIILRGSYILSMIPLFYQTKNHG